MFLLFLEVTSCTPVTCSRAPPNLAAAALVLVASSLAAQGGGAGGFVGGARGSGGSVVARRHATIRWKQFAPSSPRITPTSPTELEDNILTLMIDSNGNYVGSASSKANIVARVAPSGDTVVAMGAGGARGAGGGGAGGVISAAPAGGVARMSAATASPDR